MSKDRRKRMSIRHPSPASKWRDIAVGSSAPHPIRYASSPNTARSLPAEGAACRLCSWRRSFAWRTPMARARCLEQRSSWSKNRTAPNSGQAYDAATGDKNTERRCPLQAQKRPVKRNSKISALPTDLPIFVLRAITAGYALLHLRVENH